MKTIMQRDLASLRGTAVLRWATTAQIHALFFAAVSFEMARRRLRALRKAGYIQTRQVHQMAQSLHALTAEGRRLLIRHGWEGEIRAERELPKHLDHLIGINDIRVAVELGVKRMGWELSFFYAHWELEAGGWPHKIIPDAVCEVTGGDQSETVIFEYDRGTEGRRVILKDKLIPYAQGLQGIPFSRVIFATETEARAEQLAKLVKQDKRDLRFVFTCKHAITPESISEYFTALPVAPGVVASQRATTHNSIHKTNINL